MLPYQTSSQNGRAPRIAIVGLGGAGANILHCFSGQTNAGIALSTMALDERVGRESGVGSFLLLGETGNHGLGSGGDPAVGAAAAEESETRLRDMLRELDLLVLVTGLGGGTGSGAAPVIARLARESGVFLVVVATLPFSFEGARRRQQAEGALAQLSISANVLLCFENDHMEELLPPGKGAHEAFAEADQLLAKATAAVPMLASSPGLINLGLDELKQALRSRNARCIFGSGSARGVDRAKRAAERALESPLLSYRRALSRAGAVLVHIAGGESLSLEEIRVAMDTVAARMNPEAEIFFGTAVKPRLADELRITLISSVDPEDLAQPVEEEASSTPVPAEPGETEGEESAPEEGGASLATPETDAPETAVGKDTADWKEEQAEETPLAAPTNADEDLPATQADEADPVDEEIALPPSDENAFAQETESLREPEPTPDEEVEPADPARKRTKGKAERASAVKTRWIQSSFLQEEMLGEPENDAELGAPEAVARTEQVAPRGRQYELELDTPGDGLHPAELDNEDLDVPPALRSDKWNSMFPEE